MVGLWYRHPCQLQNRRLPVGGGVLPVGSAGAEKFALWTHSTSSVLRGTEQILSQVKHCFHSGIITYTFLDDGR